MIESKTKKIKVTRPILIEGKHAEAGSVHHVPHNVAQELIGAGTAEEYVESGEETETKPRAATTRTEEPVNREPSAKHGDPHASRRGAGG